MEKSSKLFEFLDTLGAFVHKLANCNPLKLSLFAGNKQEISQRFEANREREQTYNNCCSHRW